MPAVWKVFLYSLIFFAVGVGALGHWAFETIELTKQLTQHSALVRFHKGAFYFFGAGLALITFAVVAIISRFSNRYSQLFNVMLVVSVVVMFSIPQLAHWYISNRMLTEGYEVCADKSHRWLHDVTIVYAKSAAACAAEDERSKAPIKRRRAQPIASIAGL